MNYEQSVKHLLWLGKELAAPRQARVQKFGLENIRVLSNFLGAPHLAAPSAHIAGTNGKGSTSAMLESIFRAAGMSTGHFISPHLERINERIRLDGRPVSDEEFAALFTRVQAAIEALLGSGELAVHPTFFECVTAMAFGAFAQRPVDFAVYEVGMGGRLDSTNILQPEIALITQVDLDHENFLGHSVAEIAEEKAGIIKPGGWVVSSAESPEARTVIARRAVEVGARLVEIDTEWRVETTSDAFGRYRATATPVHSGKPLALDIPLPGRFQVRNALAAATAAKLLVTRGFAISDDDVARGIRNVKWPGRLERLAEAPTIFLDGAHNPAAAREVAVFWQTHLGGKRIWLVFGAMRDKAVDEIAGLLFPRAHKVFLTAPRQSRAISAALLSEMTAHLAPRSCVEADAETAFKAALSEAAPDDVVFVAGSLSLAGEIRELWHRSGEKPASRFLDHAQRR